jgi:hypothetical protein
MLKIQIINPSCDDDCEGERDERGSGKRRHRWHDTREIRLGQILDR